MTFLERALGTISPTSSPVFQALEDHDGCPELYDPDGDYQATDKVSISINEQVSFVFQCADDMHRSRWW
jgi:hypothetical protein